MSKYWHIFLVSLKQRNVYVFDVLSSLASYTVRILLIVSLFRYLHSTSSAMFSGLSVKELWWGLIYAQIASVGSPNFAWRVSEDVKSGKVAVHLLNPVSYPVFKVFEVFSGAFSNLAVMSVLSFGIGAYFVWLPQMSAGGILWSLLLLVGAFVMFALLGLNVWLCAFVLEEISPLQWIVRRCVMFFWGNILPIPFFPAWLQTIAYASPFAFTGYVAWLTFANFEPLVFLRHSTVMVIWLILLSASASLLYSRFSRRLVSNGG